MAHLLSDLVVTCKGRQIKIAFIYIPCAYQYDPDYGILPQKLGLVIKKEWLDRETELERRLGSLARKHKIQFLDLTPYFREAARDPNMKLNFHVDQHWTTQGHALAAKVISEWLEKEKFLNN